MHDRMPAQMVDLVFDVLSDAHLIVSYQSKFNPSDAEWNRWLAAAQLLEQQSGKLRLLVVTEGGHPTKAQVDRLREKNKTNPRTAILSPSLALRFLASAMTFINPTIRCFAPTELPQALEHVGVPPAEYKKIAATVERLRLQLPEVTSNA